VQLHDYCSIGDHGKLVLSLRRALHMGGRAVIVNDRKGGDDDVACVLERCSLDRVGDLADIDFSNLLRHEMASLHDASFDFVTMNQGLHHLRPEQVPFFLEAVARILRPGGLFIVREHDMSDIALRPVLDCAHMVFNAGTGVALVEERQEIRGFRSLIEWRQLIESVAGGVLKDTRVYSMQVC
jgi:SAM-dependent methyltransferase